MSATTEQGEDKGVPGLEEFQLSDAQIMSVIQGVFAGMNPADIYDFSPEEADNFYALGYEHYVAGNFSDAHEVFRLLCLLRRDDARFWTGLAACRQGMQDWQGAIDAYSMASVAELCATPSPFLYIGMCFVNMGDKQKAATVLDALLYVGDENDPVHAACHEKARHMLALLHE